MCVRERFRYAPENSMHKKEAEKEYTDIDFEMYLLEGSTAA